MNSSPKYEHDCKTSCRFLGRYLWEDNHEYDLYVCVDLGQPEMTDVIARHGNAPEDYASTAIACLANEKRNERDPLMKAWARAVEQRFALPAERLKELADNLLLTQDMMSASRFVEAATVFLAYGSMASARILNIARKNIEVHIRDSEPHEQEFVDAVVKYLKVLQKSAEEYEQKKR